MSPVTGNVRPGVGKGNASATATAVSHETRRQPSRAVRLARALASGLAAQDDGRDSEDDDS
jgi:hypothetical protein